MTADDKVGDLAGPKFINWNLHEIKSAFFFLIFEVLQTKEAPTNRCMNSCSN
jgi:hypothetical protein